MAGRLTPMQDNPMSPTGAPPTEPAHLERVAQALITARRTRRPVAAEPLASLLVGPSDAYAVQALVARHAAWHPDGVARWWKSGGAGRSADLTHAPLPEGGIWRSPAAAGAWPFNIRFVEAEVALRLACDVSAAQAALLTPDTVTPVIEAMAVTLELVDSRWEEGVQAPALLKLADLQSHGALVVGDWRPFAVRQWDSQVCTVRIGDAAPQEFRGTHSLGDPAWGLPAWLRHVTRAGDVAPRGTVVTTGTWCGMLPARRGERVVADFPGIGIAEVML